MVENSDRRSSFENQIHCFWKCVIGESLGTTNGSQT
jgi:hypothetical protein